jgi:tetratricopeptide (TPR) repeat protein
VRAKPRSAEEIEQLGGDAISPRATSSLPSEFARKASKGWQAYGRGDVETAKAELMDVAPRADAPPWVSYVLGWSQLALGEAAPAATAWERVRTAVPQFEPVYFDLADAYSRVGDYSKAVGSMREAEKRWPKDVEVHNALGVLQLARGAIDDAIATFETAVALDANDVNACYNLAKTLEVRLVRSDRAGKIAPGSASSSSRLVDRDRAISLYRRVVSLGGPLAQAAKEGLKRLGAE